MNKSTADVRKALHMLLMFNLPKDHLRSCPKRNAQEDEFACTCGLTESLAIAANAIGDSNWVVERTTPAPGNLQQARAVGIRDAVVEFRVVLHYNDGDRHDSLQSANSLEDAKQRIEVYLEHLRSIPFQPDR